MSSKSYKTQRFIDNNDIYHFSIPAFNIQKRNGIGSVPGLIFTYITYLSVMLFAGKKLDLLAFENDALISETI
jgi:hypothetical protein